MGLKTNLLSIAAIAAAALGCGVKGGMTPTGSGTAGDTGSTGTGGSATGTGGSASGTAGTGAGTAGSGATAGTTGSSGSTGTAGSTSSGTAGASGTGGTTGTGGATGTAGGAGGTGGTPPLSGITVTIGGMTLPKENVIAFVNFGHSNMAGRGVSPADVRPYFFGAPDPHAWMYHSGAGFQPAVEPKTAGDSGNNVNGMVSGGPSTALVKEAVALNPSKYFVTVPFGAGMAYCSQFLPGGLYYNKAMDGAKEIKDKVTWGGIVLLLGITERHGTQADIDNYPQCINQLVTAVRTDLGQPNLPLLLNDYEMGATGPLAPVPTDAFFVAIRPKILMVPMVVSNSAIIPTDNPIIPIEDIIADAPDEHHFTLAGHQEYVRRVLMTMMTKGWAPWLTP